MLANFEQRDTSGAERVWTGRYRNLHNLPHWHLENELICVERGTVTVSHNHREYTLTTGEAIFLAIISKAIRTASLPLLYLTWR